MAEDPLFIEKLCSATNEEQSEELQKLTMHPEKVIISCGLWANGITGAYFFKDDANRTVTVNGERYRDMISNFLFPKLQALDMWFQQDGATCHTSRVTMHSLRGEFGEHIISRSGPVNWPPKSCDLTPIDYFLCPLQLTHWKTTLKHLFVRYRPKCWKEYAKIGLSGWTI